MASIAASCSQRLTRRSIAALRERMKTFKALSRSCWPRRASRSPHRPGRPVNGHPRGAAAAFVGYNVQTVDTKNLYFVAHEVTNVGNDRAQLANMAGRAKAMGVETLDVLADRATSMAKRRWPASRRSRAPFVPAADLGAKAHGRFGK